MTYFLQKQGLTGEYSAKSTEAKRRYLESWFADQLTSKKAKVTQSAVKETVMNRASAHLYKWMSKQAMINDMGEQKALSKIDSGKLASRADPDTGLDTEWTKEFKVYTDTGGDSENVSDKTTLAAAEELNGDADINEAKASMAASSSCMAGGSGPPVPEAAKGDIKKEGGKAEKPKEVAMQHGDTLRRLQTDTKREMRACADKLMVLKEIFEKTKNGKYTQQIHQDAQALIPKMASLIVKVEKTILAECTDEPTLLAIAKNIDTITTSFEEVQAWYQRMVPKKPAAKKHKA